MKGQGLLIVLVLVCFLGAGVCNAIAAKFYRESLRGLEGVWVVIEYLQPYAEQAGLTRGQLQTDVELRLRKAGVRVLTAEEGVNAKGRPRLYVNVTIATSPNIYFYAYTVLVEVRQRVRLERAPSTEGAASTWRRHVTGCGAKAWRNLFTGCDVKSDFVGQVRSALESLVDMFIKDYLAENPITPAS
jgi:hypothetical protein